MTREDKILDHFASFIPNKINTESLKEMAMYDALCEVKALIAENAALRQENDILKQRMLTLANEGNEVMNPMNDLTRD